MTERLIETRWFGVHRIERSATVISVINAEWDTEILTYEYGSGWIMSSEGYMKKTDDPMATVISVLDNVDVGGYPQLEDDVNRCVVCDAPCEERWCSEDCVAQDRDTQDNR